MQEWEHDQSLLEIFRPHTKDRDEMKDYQFVITTLKNNLSILKRIQELDEVNNLRINSVIDFWNE